MPDPSPINLLWAEREKLDAFIERCDDATRERAALWLRLFSEYILAGEQKRGAIRRRLAVLEVQIIGAAPPRPLSV